RAPPADRQAPQHPDYRTARGAQNRGEEVSTRSGTSIPDDAPCRAVYVERIPVLVEHAAESTPARRRPVPRRVARGSADQSSADGPPLRLLRLHLSECSAVEL